jgi:hypothetical protein
MGPVMVVTVPPVLGHASHFSDRGEDIEVQYFGSEGAVEALDIGVLCRLAGLDRVIDRDNDYYLERIVDPETGEVIRECEEKLSEHQGRGSAKPKGDG